MRKILTFNLLTTDQPNYVTPVTTPTAPEKPSTRSHTCEAAVIGNVIRAVLIIVLAWLCPKSPN